MLSNVSEGSLRPLSFYAAKTVSETALKHTDHENSAKILNEIAYWDKKGSNLIPDKKLYETNK